MVPFLQPSGQVMVDLKLWWTFSRSQRSDCSPLLFLCDIFLSNAIFFFSDHAVEVTRRMNCITVTYSELRSNTKTTQANRVLKILSQQHVINTSLNPDSGHKSNFIRRNEVIIANQPLKVQYQQFLGCSSGTDTLPCISNTEHSSVTRITM